jgi:hypothetical protein
MKVNGSTHSNTINYLFKYVGSFVLTASFLSFCFCVYSSLLWARFLGEFSLKSFSGLSSYLCWLIIVSVELQIQSHLGLEEPRGLCFLAATVSQSGPAVCCGSWWFPQYWFYHYFGDGNDRHSSVFVADSRAFKLFVVLGSLFDR